MHSKAQVVHKVEFTIQVNSVKIQIRFPCKLEIGLKLGKEQINLKQEVELKSGNATFSEALRSETYLAYDSNSRKYVDKKATLTIYVVSTRGKNVAGIFPIQLAHILNRSDQEQSFFNEKLQRCPDKDATINLKVKGNLVEQIQDGNMSLVGDLSLNPGIPPFSGRSTTTMMSINSEIPKMDSRFLSSPRIESTLSTKKIQRSFGDRSNKKSYVDQVGTQSQNRILVDSYSQIRKTSSRQQSSTINETFKLKTKIDELQNQNELLKREVTDKKKYQNQIQALSYKISELQKVISSNRIEIESTNKQKKRDNNDLNNRIEELQKLNVTLQKRSDAKNSFYKQEIQKYNHKLLSSQSQKQQLGLDITNLKDQVFDLNRKINGYKDKEKLLNEQKGKLNKKVDELKKQLLQKQTTVDTGAKDLIYQRLKQTISNNELEKLALMEQLQKLKAQVLNESIFRTKYQQELRQKNNIIQQKLQLQNLSREEVERRDLDISRLKKQLSDKNQQIQELNKIILETNNKGKLQSSKLNEQIKKIQRELGSTKVSQEKGRQQSQQISNTLQQIQQQLSQSMRRNTNLDSTIKQIQAENEQLRKNNKNYQEETKAQSNEIKRLTDIIHDLQNQYSIESQSKRNNQLEYKSEVSKLQIINKQTQSDLLMCQQQLFSTQSQLAQNQNNFFEQLEKKDRVLREKQIQLQRLYEAQTNLQMINVQLQSKQSEGRDNLRLRQSQLNKEKTLLENLRKINLTLEQSQAGLKNALSETRYRLEQKELQCESLIEANQSLDYLLNNTRVQFDTFKENIIEHIHTLLKNLVTRGKPEEIIVFGNLPQGLLKLETDVITKVKGCYEQLEITNQKLLNREMESINLEQNSNLQVQTLQIELAQSRKQFELMKQEGLSLSDNMQGTIKGLLAQNQDLKRQMKDLEYRLTQQLSFKLNDSSTRYEKESAKMKEEQYLERNHFQSRIRQLETRLAQNVKELEDQYNQVSIFGLKNYQMSETIRELEEKLNDTRNKEGLLESDKNKFMEDIYYLDQELQKVSKLYETVDRNLVLVLEREAILVEENEYLRNEFQGGHKGEGARKEFQTRERSIIQSHRINAENSRLAEMVRGLELRLGDKESMIKGLQDKVKYSHGNNNLFVIDRVQQQSFRREQSQMSR